MPLQTSPLFRTLVSLASLTTVTTTVLFSPAIRATLQSLFSPRAHPIRFVSLLLALLVSSLLPPSSMPLPLTTPRSSTPNPSPSSGTSAS